MKTGSSKKIRIGLLLNSLEVPAWVYLMLQKILASQGASIELVILNNTFVPERSFITKIKSNWSHLAYILYDKIDRAIHKVAPDAFALRDLGDFLENVDTIEVVPKATRFSDYFQENDLARIKDYQLDVLVRLGFRILRGDILKSARLGIWSYHHGDNTVNQGGPPGFWEVMQRKPVTGTVLQILTEQLDDGMVLSRSYSATDTLSVTRSKNALYWKSASVLPRELALLVNMGAQRYLESKHALNRMPGFYPDRLYTEPGNLELARIFPGYLLHYISRRIRNVLTIEHWFLMYKLNGPGKGVSTSFWQYRELMPPDDRFWADPFVIYANNRYYVFIEEYMYSTNKAHISVLEFGDDGPTTQPVRIIDRPYHLSYPFIFEWQGQYFLVPESSENKTIEVYRCLDFPHKWELHKVLMSGVTAVDSTLLQHDGRWWLFTNMRENQGASTYDELFLFYADTPFSDNWTAHPQNPVISDVRKARPAGKIFCQNGVLYRPAQNCSNEYGYGLVINEVKKLTTTEYEETVLQSMSASWEKRIKGVHTLNNVNDLTFIDGKLRKFKFLH